MNMDEIREKRGFICDMDGVIYHVIVLLVGLNNFVNWLKK
jgi:NagD protein